MADSKNDTEIAYSAPDIFGGVTHFNSRGEQVGYSMPDKMGVMVNHDASGHIIGYSAPDLFGGTTHYDAKGGETGYSYPDLMGGTCHRDKFGHDVGYSYTNKATGISAGRFNGVDNPSRFTSAPGRVGNADGKGSIGSSSSVGGLGSDGSTASGFHSAGSASGDPARRIVPGKDSHGLIVLLTLYTVIPILTTALLLWVHGAIAWFFGVPLLIIASGFSYLLYRVKKAEKE